MRTRADWSLADFHNKTDVAAFAVAGLLNPSSDSPSTGAAQKTIASREYLATCCATAPAKNKILDLDENEQEQNRLPANLRRLIGTAFRHRHKCASDLQYRSGRF
jgi:hypothetical protein